MPDVFVELRAVISEFQEKMVIAREEMEKTSKAGGGHFSALSGFATAGLAGVATTAVAIGAASVKMGNELEDAHVKMVTAIRDTGGNMETLGPKINQADKAMENFGFTNTQTQDALAVGTTALGSSSKALSILTTAANLAAYKHIDLATAEVAVAKGTEGNLRPLKQLGIDLPVVASSAEKVAVAQQNLAKAQAKVTDLLKQFPNAASPASAAHAKYETAIGKVSDAQQKLSNLQKAGGDILDGLNKRMGGQAAAAADTFSGKMKVAKTRIEDAGAALGVKLIPWIEKAIDWISKMVTWMDKHQAITKILAIAIGTTLVAAFVASTIAAMSFWTAVTLGIAPLLVALVVGVIYVATHWKQVWGDIKKVFDDAVAFMRGRFGTLALLIVGPIGWLALLALHWHSIWTGIQTVIHVAVRDLLGFFKTLGDGFFNLIQGILTAGSHLPFVGKYFKQANDAVKQAHQDFDSTMTQWARDANTFGNKVGDGFSTGAAYSLAAGLPKVKGAGNYMVGQTAKSMRFTATEGGNNVGSDMSAGMAAGVAKATNQATAAANLLVRQTLGAMEKSARTSSPSKATMEIGENMALGVMVGIEKQKLAAMKAAGQFASAVVTTIGGGVGAGAQTGQPGGWAAAGQAMAASMYGWTGPEWVALNNVAMRESGWNPNAQNPTSSAYGIAQNIGGRAGYPDPSPAGQIAWMLAYIKSRYGDPIGAWAHELSAGWYDRGGRLPPGLSLAYNATGRDEVIAPGGAHGMTINVYVGGSVVTEQGIVNAIHTGLLEKQKRVPLGLRAS